MNRAFKKDIKNFKWAEIAIIAALAVGLGYVILFTIKDNTAKDRDAIRISAVNQIRVALGQYYDTNGRYPACLYAKKNCPSLEGSLAMAVVPRDPLTNANYAYASIGTGTDCRTFHLGVSLERSGSQALLTGSDAPPEPASALCTGSDADFSGLSFAPGGEPCDAIAGIAEPSNLPKAETCYDLKPRKR